MGSVISDVERMTADEFFAEHPEVTKMTDRPVNRSSVQSTV